MNYFITGIDTDSGKTLVSSVFCEAFGADYWKPIQCGPPRDKDTVKNLVSNPRCVFHNEIFFLKTPASPHTAAKLEGVSISLNDFKVPVAKNGTMVIEGAGGCLVPLNDHDFIIDLIPLFNADIILVADLYLGSINHTLLTLEAIRHRKLPLKGIVFNGESNTESERIILRHAATSCLLKIDREKEVTKEVITRYASDLKERWYA